MHEEQKQVIEVLAGEGENLIQKIVKAGGIWKIEWPMFNLFNDISKLLAVTTIW